MRSASGGKAGKSDSVRKHEFGCNTIQRQQHMSIQPTVRIRGAEVYKGFLSPERQQKIVADIRAVLRKAPLFSPVTAGGRRMSVRITSAGALGWISDRKGYRYEPCHPSGTLWPPIPESVLDPWCRILPATPLPDSCLINFYAPGARMGMHQDRDEADLRWPILSVSLGDDAVFRIGRVQRGGATQSVVLSSGDVLVMRDEARLAYHGIERICPGTSCLLRNGGRLNLTLRIAGNRA